MASWVKHSHTVALSLPVAGQVATHGGGPGRWPKTQPGRAPTGCYLVPSGERRKGGRQASSTFLGGEPQGPFQDTDVPQVDTGQGNRSHSRVQGRLMTAVFCCRFPSCSGREAAWGWWGRGGGGWRGGGKSTHDHRESQFPAFRAHQPPPVPVGGCMCGNETGRGRERGKSKQAVLGCYPPISCLS